MKRALIIVDMQKKFYRGFGKESMDRATPAVNSLLDQFRSNGEAVVWIQHESKRMGLIPSHPDFALIDSLNPRSDERIVVKRKGNGFLGTDLQQVLSLNAVDVVYLCGYAAEACVNQTYKGAKQRGFSAFKVRDGIASGNSAFLWFSGLMGDYKKTDDILS